MTNFCIDILNEQDLIDLDLNEIKKRSEQLLCLLFKDKEIIEKSVFKNINVNEKELYVDILICTNKKIHQLNKQYRNKDQATDVLTFALFADNPNIKMVCDNNISIGSIVLSTEYIQDQAKEYNNNFEQEFYFLLSHGLLHLLGFCHDNEQSLNYMINLQNQMVKGIEK